MIDRKNIEHELQQARLARMDAEAANCDLEELIWDVQHVRLGRQRVIFSIDGFDFEPACAG
jgi:hypothetical protein